MNNTLLNETSLLMRPALLLGCLTLGSLLAASTDARAEVVTQIPSPFVTETFLGGTGALSQFDTGATGGFLANFAFIYDNFTLTTDNKITEFSWIGYYEVEPPAGPLVDSITLSIYNDVAGEPGAAIFSQNVGSANETAVPGFDGFYSYNAAISPLTVNLGETYWWSVVGAVDFVDNGWGVALSDIGDDNSVREFQANEFDPLQRFTGVGVDYAFSVTAVPEPSSIAAIAVLAGVGMAWRRRKAKSRS